METHGWLMAILATRQGDVDMAFDWLKRNWGMATMFVAVISGGSVTYTQVYATAAEVRDVKQAVVDVRADVRLILRNLNMKPREARRTNGDTYLDPTAGALDLSVEGWAR